MEGPSSDHVYTTVSKKIRKNKKNKKVFQYNRLDDANSGSDVDGESPSRSEISQLVTRTQNDKNRPKLKDQQDESLDLGPTPVLVGTENTAMIHEAITEPFTRSPTRSPYNNFLPFSTTPPNKPSQPVLPPPPSVPPNKPVLPSVPPNKPSQPPPPSVPPNKPSQPPPPSVPTNKPSQPPPPSVPTNKLSQLPPPSVPPNKPSQPVLPPLPPAPPNSHSSPPLNSSGEGTTNIYGTSLMTTEGEYAVLQPVGQVEGDLPHLDTDYAPVLIEGVHSSEVTAGAHSTTYKETTSDAPTSSPKGKHYYPTSCSMSLMELAHSRHTVLPQLVRAENDYKGSDTIIAKGDVLMASYLKEVKAVRGRDAEGKDITLLLNSKATVSPILSDVRISQKLTAKDLLSETQLPPALKVIKKFKDALGCNIKAETLLFITKPETEGDNEELLVTTDANGKSVHISASTGGLFSTHPDDVKLFLPELVYRCQFPQKVLPEDGMYSSDILSLTAFCQTKVLLVQTCDRRTGEPQDKFLELPINCSLQVVKIALDNKTMEENIYASLQEVINVEVKKEDQRRGGNNDHDYEEVPDLFSWRKRYSQDTLEYLRDKGYEISSVVLSNSGEVAMQQNISELKDLSVGEVVNLLEAMKLHQYKGTFYDKNINGFILSKIDPHNLAKILGISQSDHQNQIRQIINGEVSTKAILKQYKT